MQAVAGDFPILVFDKWVYSDRSKTNSGAGAEVYSNELNLKYSISRKYIAVYKTELVALIHGATDVLAANMTNKYILCLTVSKAILLVLKTNKFKLKLLAKAHQILANILKANKVTLVWVKDIKITLEIELLMSWPGNMYMDHMASTHSYLTHWNF